MTGSGQHDRKNMELARGVRMNLGITDTDAALHIFNRWYADAKPHLANQDYDDSMMKFLRGHARARFPLGASGLAAQALALARTCPPPTCADKFQGDRMRLVVGMCYQLHLLAGRGSFKLSCHQLGDLFGVSHPQAWSWLRMLEQLHVLHCVNRGSSGRPGHGAATFTFIGDVAERIGKAQS